ncbi:MAG: protein kinase [Gammaproteobacteria bacterium]|nr:protein kinase [Gammaproteobacteria bacterium]
MTTENDNGAASAGIVGRMKRLLSRDAGGKSTGTAPPSPGHALLESGRRQEALVYFMKQPADTRTLSEIFNLGVDFEREGEFRHAAAAYRHILRHDPAFENAAARVAYCESMVGPKPAAEPPSAWHTEEPAPASAGGGSGVMLGPYAVEKELGRGAMGVVYLARHPETGRRVAVKTLALYEKFEDDEIDEVKARLFQEAKTAGRLSHPNIVSILDAGEALDLAYVVMEYVAGHDLKQHTREGSLLSLPEVLKIAAQAAQALDYAHDRSVVHRDIKPANILFEPVAGQVKLTDFGIARMIASGKTRSGEVLGTPSYMSPEQLAGKDVDGRSDLFSLGVTVYELCTGKLPFHGESIADVMTRITSEPHTDLLSVRPDLPSDLKSIIDKSLQKSADQRYSRGADMAGDLMNCAASLSSQG